jgi:glutamine synthetase
LGDIVQNHIIPAVIKYQNILLENVSNQKNIFEQSEFEQLAKQPLELIKYISKTINEIQELNDLMRRARKHANNVEDIVESTRLYIDNVKPYLFAIREKVDKLERVIDDQLWPLPKYREMLYSL